MFITKQIIKTKKMNNPEFNFDWKYGMIYNSSKKPWGWGHFIGSSNYKFLRLDFFNKKYFEDMKILIKDEPYKILEIIDSNTNNLSMLTIEKITNNQ